MPEVAHEARAAHEQWRVFLPLDALADVAHEVRPTAAARISADRRSGDSGSALIDTPSGASASATAFAIAPPQAELPPSPAPFTPSGLSGVGVSSRIRISVVSGISITVGSR